MKKSSEEGCTVDGSFSLYGKIVLLQPGTHRRPSVELFLNFELWFHSPIGFGGIDPTLGTKGEICHLGLNSSE